VLGASPVPVVLLRPGGKRLTSVKKLLVPVDGSAGGTLALAAATGVAKASEADITLVQVVQPLPTWVYGAELGFASAEYMDPAWEEETLAGAQAYVDGLVARLGQSGYTAHARTVKGEVAASIEALSAELDVDVIVMSTHALTGPARAILGSVADEVVRNAKRPVLLVRRTGDADE
jgi:nucleotide-binding universal stress UspA family protein